MKRSAVVLAALAMIVSVFALPAAAKNTQVAGIGVLVAPGDALAPTLHIWVPTTH